MTEVLDALSRWTSPNGTQEKLRGRFLDYAATHSNPTNRECRPDHFTASALVLNQTGSHVLLGLHRKVGRWLQFGGHIEPNDPSVAAAALREAQEESGIFDLQLSDPEPVQLDVHPAPCAHDARFHLDVEFLAIAKNGSLPQASAESLAVQWFDADDLPSDTDDAVRRLVTASVRRLDMHAR